jgi:hypothetical protein
MDTLISSIELKRGSTLKLECPAPTTLRLLDGRAWLSAGEISLHLTEGRPISVNGQGATLVYALHDVSLGIETTAPCRIELRKRGAVAPLASSSADEERIDVDDAAELERWTQELCTTRQALRKAVAAVGPRVGDVKRHLLVTLVRWHSVAR